MVDYLSTVVHSLPICMLTLLLVDEISVPRYSLLILRGLPFDLDKNAKVYRI